MTSHFAVGIQQPPPQLPAAHGVGRSRNPHHDHQLHSGPDQLTRNQAEIPSAAVPLPVKHPLDRHTSKRADDVSSTVKMEPSADDHQPPTLDYTEVAPFPPRPLLNPLIRKPLPGATSLMKATPPSTASNNSIADARAQGVEAPAVARIYPQANVADFSPWKGKQVEDSMSEPTIKSGFQNKPLITNESNTARPSLWSHLKNKGGPQTLSSLFVNLLEKRQVSGRVTGSSTFKPPPRLAMSNARRESFFRELSDPSWPMRKLNRSVPHTISGRVLLDQCLSKNIPIPRAVWLAKCIGANDIRALKRKSAGVTTTMGSEGKYIKDWTVHVEQFLKSVISSVGETDWKVKADYAIRLSSHLFSEHLLDEEHYLDWLLALFESCSTQHLPVWLLVIQIYWTSLTVNRRRGIRLVESLLNHLEHLTADDSEDLLRPAIERVEALLTVLATHHSGCLILPRSWSRFRSLVISMSSTTSDPEVKASISKVTFRNDHLAGLSTSNGNGNSSRKSQIVHLLDQFALHLSISDLSKQCLDVEPDTQSLVHVILRWSSSVYRQGAYRIYVAARLLKKLRQEASYLDELLWGLVQELSFDSGVSKLSLFKVVAELVRARQFSVGRFIQHLISIGAADSNNDRHRCLLELLNHIPDRGLDFGIASMRTELLESAGLSSISTRDAFEKLEDNVLDRLSSADTDFRPDFEVRIRLRKGLSLSQAFDLGHQIRNHMLSTIQEIVETGSGHWNKPDAVKSFEGSFFLARDLLEKLGQYPCLVDMLGMSLDFDNQVVLTSVVHTIHYGHRSYIGIGAMKGLFDKLISAYENIRNHQPLIRPFCSAILELSTTLDANKSLISQLSQDVLRSDQLNAAAICSPASDNADIMQLSNPDFEDEMERVLSSGTSMDERLVVRVFDRMLKKIQETYTEATSHRLPFGNWLARLRSFDPTNFDTMLRRNITALLSTREGSELLNELFLPILVGGSCMSLAEYLAYVQSTNKVRGGLEFSAQSNVDLLKTLLPSAEGKFLCAPQDSYKFKLEQQVFAKNFSSSIINLLQSNLLTSIGNSETSTNPIDINIILSPPLVDFLIDSLATSREDLTGFASMIRSLDETFIARGCLLIDALLDPSQKLDLTHAPSAEKPARIISLMDELSAPFCTLGLDAFQCEMAVRKTSTITKSNELAAFLFESVTNTAHEEDSAIFSILSSLHIEIRQQLFQVAEDRILSTNIDGQGSTRAMQNYLKVAKLTSDSFGVETDMSIPSNILDKFRAIINSLASELEQGQANLATDERMKTDPQVLDEWINTLSCLIIIRRQACDSQKFQQHDNLTLIALLSALILYPQLQPLTNTIDFVFDVLAMLVDDLSDEQRSFIAKSDFWRTSDPRLNFLQGPTSSFTLDTWLGLVLTQQPPPSGAGSNSAPSSQGTPAAPRTPIHQTSSSHPSPRPQQSSQVSRGQPQAQSQQVPTRAPAAQNATAQKNFLPPVQYPLKYWELIWDQGSTGAANDTAISLGLFGMRKA